MNDPRNGTGGVGPSCTLRISNGIRPTQARSSNVSTMSPSGNRRCTTSGSYDQWKYASSSQRCRITVRRSHVGGSGEIISTEALGVDVADDVSLVVMVAAGRGRLVGGDRLVR
ncbi:MAG: hypothetical protein RIB65_10705 [Ilumatobacter fluminis]